MIPIQGIDHVALNVKNLDESLQFYTEILGLKITAREFQKPGIEYFLDAGTSLIGLIQAASENPHHPFQQEGLGANHLSFRVKASDFDATVKALENRGVKVLFVKKRPKSWSVYFLDPDGNKLEITSWPQEESSSW